MIPTLIVTLVLAQDYTLIAPKTPAPHSADGLPSPGA